MSETRMNKILANQKATRIQITLVHLSTLVAVTLASFAILG